MIDRLVSLAVHRRFLILGIFAAVVIGGLIAFEKLNIEAYPDPTAPMVDVVTQSAGMSAEEIERYITIPIETQVAGIKNLRVIRTISLYGLSDVKLQFSFDYTYEEALQQVLNRLSQLTEAGTYLASAGFFDPKAVEPLAEMGQFAAASYVAAKATPQRQYGLFDLLRLLKEPEIQRTINIVTTMSRYFGRKVVPA